MSHAQLTYRDLDKAFAFMRGSEDEHEEVTTDHPEFYGTRGGHRGTLPHLSDREVRSFRDEEDAMIARLDSETDKDDADDDELCEPVVDDMDIEFGTSASDDQEYSKAWQTHVDQVVDTVVAPCKVPSVLETPALNTHEKSLHDVVTTIDADDDTVESRIMARRHVIATSPMGTFLYKNPPRGDWKGSTKAPTQFLRHAGRVQPLR